MHMVPLVESFSTKSKYINNSILKYTLCHLTLPYKVASRFYVKSQVFQTRIKLTNAEHLVSMTTYFNKVFQIDQSATNSVLATHTHTCIHKYQRSMYQLCPSHRKHRPG